MATISENTLINTGWVEHHAGYEHTRSERIIRQMVSWLRDSRQFVTLLHKGYQSGGTLVVAADDRTVTLDKPRDWPGSNAIVRVVFRNTARLWCHFTGEVTATTVDTLRMSFPDELFMLQRRQHFRINVPADSSATFLYNQKKCKCNIVDVSAGGMLLAARDIGGLPQPGHTIRNISITIPCDDKAVGAENGLLRIKVKEAEAVRFFRNESARTFCLGVNFSLTPAEEERLMRYIRQRELAMLRKGVND